MNRRDIERERLTRRLAALRAPVVPLRRVGSLSGTTFGHCWEDEPAAVGIGPDDTALAVRRSRTGPPRWIVTVHDGGRQPLTATELRGRDGDAFRPRFVQPLPGGRILLAAGRTRGSLPNAEIWTADGERERTGTLGDAIEHLQTTAAGAIWAGYFDEAMAGPPPQSHGLARFDDGLAVAWLYPRDAGLPQIFDCYGLTVVGETAWHYTYTTYHVGAVTGGRAVDHGPAPHRAAGAQLLVDGPRLGLSGGGGPEYDLVTPLRLTRDGIVGDGAARRLVLPDGMEISAARILCRGADMHVILRGQWFRLSLDEIITGGTDS